jgi:hypothetical protein
MTYEEAKSRQIDCFKEGVYLLIVMDYPGHYILRDAPSREAAERDMLQDVVAVVRRLPTRLRVIPGGKKC